MTKTLHVGMTLLLLGMVGTAGAADIAGIVVDDADKPVADAKIVIQDITPRTFGFSDYPQNKVKGQVQSGTDGKFSLTVPDLEKENGLNITVIHPNYGFTSLTSYELYQEGKFLSECRIVLPKRSFIQGKVVDTADKPVKDAEITVILLLKKTPTSKELLPDKSFLSTKTDAEGAFKLDGLPEESAVIVRASHPDFAIGIAGEPNPEGTLAVGTKDILIKLQHGAILEGKITQEGTGKPVAKVPVIAIPQKTTSLKMLTIPDCVETDKNGAFSIKSLAPGKYAIQTASFTEEAITPRTVEVTQAGRMTGQDLIAKKGVRIAGKFVKADTKESIGGGNITLSAINTPLNLITLKVKPDGTFEGRVAPGKFMVQASIKNGSLTESVKSITLVAGQDLADLVFEVKPLLVFKGRVLGTDGKPVEGARILRSTEKPIVTTQGGLFEFPLPSLILQKNTTRTFLFQAVLPDNPDVCGMLSKQIKSEADLTGDITLIPMGSVQGKIIWEGTGNPVAKVLVVATPVKKDRSNSVGIPSHQALAKTDDNGVFLIKDLMPDTYTLKDMSFNDGVVIPRTVEVVQAAKLTDQNLTATKGVRVAGKFVAAETKEPVSGGRVYAKAISDPTGDVAFKVKNDGTFEGRMLPGNVTVQGNTQNGYVTKAEWKLTLVAGQDQTDIVFEVHPPLMFKGRVLGIDGKPIAGAEVVGQGGGTEKTVVSNQEGRFEYPLPSYFNPDDFIKGALYSFNLKATLPDKPDLCGTFSRNIAQSNPTGDIVMVPMGTIQGKVTWEGTGVPIANVAMVALPENRSAMNSEPERTVTDDKGLFLIANVMPGKYLIKSDSFAEGIISAKSIEVAPGAKMTGQDLSASKGIRIAGKFIKADTKEPVGNGNVYVHSNNEPNSGTSFNVKSDGTFEGRALPGEVVLYANVENAFLPPEQAQKTLTLVAGQDQTDIVFEIKPPLTFKGHILDTEGKPIAGVKVTSKMYGEEKYSVSNQEGLFEYPLPSFIRFQNRETLFLEASHPDKPGLRSLLTKAIAGEEDLKGDIVMKPVGIIRGKVLDKDGKPVPSAKISTTVLAENYGISDLSADCDTKGQFDIKNAFSGANYSVTATAEKYGEARTTQNVIEPGATWDVGDLVLPVADKVIEGTIKDEEGKPVANVQLQCRGDGTGNRSTQSDDKGHFRFENLVDETVQINAWLNVSNNQLYTNASATAGDTEVELTLMDQSRRSSQEETKSLVLFGKEAPALDVAVWVSGEAATLESLQGTPVVLAFFKNEDKASDDLLTQLTKIAEKYPKLSILAVGNAGTDHAVLKKKIEALAIKFRVAIDKPGSKTGVTTEKYKPRVPAIYLIGSDGKIHYQDLAFPVIEKALQSMLDGK